MFQTNRYRKAAKLKDGTLRHPPQQMIDGEVRYRGTKVVKATGVSFRQLQWWDEKDVIKPLQDKHTRWYSVNEILMVAVLHELRQSTTKQNKNGYALQRTKVVLRALRRDLGSRNIMELTGEHLYLVTDCRIYKIGDAQSAVRFAANAKRALSFINLTELGKKISAIL